jgi:hypothetical protein
MSLLLEQSSWLATIIASVAAIISAAAAVVSVIKEKEVSKNYNKICQKQEIKNGNNNRISGGDMTNG